MSQLHELKLRIEEKIRADKLDETAVKGRIGLKAGKLLAFITPATPDDAIVIAKMKAAAKEVLNIDL